MPLDSGKQKVIFCRRLGNSWRDLALCLDIPIYDQEGFAAGDEGRDILTWLEIRDRSDELPEALDFIGRGELAVLLKPPSESTSTVPRWTRSPYPGLLAFPPEYALVFCGRDRHTNELVERLNDPQHRFTAVVGASGSGKSSVVAAGVLPRLQQASRWWEAEARDRRQPVASGFPQAMAISGLAASCRAAKYSCMS